MSPAGVDVPPLPTEAAVLPPHRAPQRRSAVAGWLWLASVLALAPALVPLVFLAGRVIGSGSTAAQTLVSLRTGELLVRSTLFTAAVTISAMVVGVAAAWLVTRTDLPGRRTWMVVVALPLVIPSYVIALSLLSFFGPRGLAAGVTGLSLPAATGFPAAWAALTLSTYPYVFLVVVAALRRLDPTLEESARSLGATPWRAFHTVVLPQLRPAIAGGGLLAALYTLSDFGAVSLAQFDVFTRVIYAQYQGRLDRTPAAVLSVVLILLAIAILWADQRSRGRARYFTARPARPARPVPLGRRARLGASAFLASVVIAGIGLPVTVLATWLVRGIAGGRRIDMRWDAVAGSLTGSALAAAVAAVIAVPIAVLVVRHASRASAWIERAVYAVFSIPHITLALAVVFFAANYLGRLYQSLGLLVVVYATVFLAQAVSSNRTALLQIDPHLEEAARGLGKSYLRSLRDITLPLMRRGILAGAALVFLTTMKELPVTLLLRPIEFDTLAVRIWSASSELFYARAAAPALLLLAVSALPMYLLVIRQEASR